MITNYQIDDLDFGEAMKGKKSFTIQEIEFIKKLINKKVRATRNQQVSIRNQIRKIGFYFSDFSSKKGYNKKDFEFLIETGQVKLTKTKTSKRLDTKLESEGAEFLVLGQLLINKIPAYKTYTNMPGYDIVAVNPAKNSSAKIQVKSRWKTNPAGFLIKNFECDFVAVVLLNRGSKDKKKEILSPEYYVFPVKVLKRVLRKGNWSRVMFNDINDMGNYKENWKLITSFMKER